MTLGQAAKAADGAPINGAYQFRFATAGFLEVGQVIPANGAQDVQAGAAITGAVQPAGRAADGGRAAN